MQFFFGQFRHLLQQDGEGEESWKNKINFFFSMLAPSFSVFFFLSISFSSFRIPWRGKNLHIGKDESGCLRGVWGDKYNPSLPPLLPAATSIGDSFN